MNAELERRHTASITMHGVADIDPAIRFNISDLKGRVVALATIYNYK